MGGERYRVLFEQLGDPGFEYQLVLQTTTGDKLIGGLSALWEQMKATLPEEAVTYDIANGMGRRLVSKGQYEEAKVFFPAALEGQRRVLGAEHKDTLSSLNNMGVVLQIMEDYARALD